MQTARQFARQTNAFTHGRRVHSPMIRRGVGMLCIGLMTVASLCAQTKKDTSASVNLSTLRNASIWHDPGDVASLDLLHGAGGVEGAPVGPIRFLDEDLNGTNPKMDVVDAHGTKWRVKVGPEARPEVAASRLLWAMGFYVEDDYNLPTATVTGIHMKRRSDDIKGDQVIDARFARKPDGEKKIGIWQWKTNPFTGTREFDGLRVMMALMNSWDLKDVNNAVLRNKKTRQDVFLVSDLGATFATNGLVLPIKNSKGDLESFRKSKFIEKQTATTVSFGTPKAPTGMLFETFGTTTVQYATRKGFEWIGNDIPLSDARWMGSMLARLTTEQISDAFRAAGFPAGDVAEYTVLIENRIQLLNALGQKP